ncbi:MAG: TIGR02281 family clan AA aspartic protease [Pseudomonadota bacterium]
MASRVSGWPVLFLLLAAWPAAAVETIDVQDVFKNKALVTLDGRKVMLKVGDPAVDGVRLVHTDTLKETIAVEINGKEQTLRLGMVRGALASGGGQKALLFADGGGHYRADGAINGVPVQFLVDTGATRIALSGSTARSIGLDYQRLGRVGRAATASGVVYTYNLSLDKVQVGEITLHNVEASVIEGSFPLIPLLGMSFLGQLDMKRDSNRMELIKN